MNEPELVRRFHETFPHSEDYYLAQAFFRASGLSEPQAHALAEQVTNNERSHPMKQLSLGLILGSVLTGSLV
ncbi:MAG: hypothetical protein ABIU05_04300 [Nitrospirales bacterium]